MPLLSGLRFVKISDNTAAATKATNSSGEQSSGEDVCAGQTSNPDKKRKHRDRNKDADRETDNGGGDKKARKKAKSKKPGGKASETKRSGRGTESASDWIDQALTGGVAPEDEATDEQLEQRRRDEEIDLEVVKGLRDPKTKRRYGLYDPLKGEQEDTAATTNTAGDKGGLTQSVQDGGGGLPGTYRPRGLSGVGDKGAGWRAKALKRAREKAEKTGQSLEELVGERWGSLDQLKRDSRGGDAGGGRGRRQGYHKGRNELASLAASEGRIAPTDATGLLGQVGRGAPVARDRDRNGGSRGKLRIGRDAKDTDVLKRFSSKLEDALGRNEETRSGRRDHVAEAGPDSDTDAGQRQRRGQREGGAPGEAEDVPRAGRLRESESKSDVDTGRGEALGWRQREARASEERERRRQDGRGDDHRDDRHYRGREDRMPRARGEWTRGRRSPDRNDGRADARWGGRDHGSGRDRHRRGDDGDGSPAALPSRRHEDDRSGGGSGGGSGRHSGARNDDRGGGSGGDTLRHTRGIAGGPASDDEGRQDEQEERLSSRRGENSADTTEAKKRQSHREHRHAAAGGSRSGSGDDRGGKKLGKAEDSESRSKEAAIMKDTHGVEDAAEPSRALGNDERAIRKDGGVRAGSDEFEPAVTPGPGEERAAPTKLLSEAELTKLAVAAMKAKLKGDMAGHARLTEEARLGREANAVAAAAAAAATAVSAPPSTTWKPGLESKKDTGRRGETVTHDENGSRQDAEELEVVTVFGENGRPLRSGKASLMREDLKTGKGKVKKVRERWTGQEGESVADFVRREREQGFENMDETFLRNVSRLGSRFKGTELGGAHTGLAGEDEEEEVDMRMFQRPEDRMTDKAAAERQRARAVADHRRQAAATSRCRFCMESPGFDKRLILSLGEHTFLYLATGTRRLTDGHCYIVPIRHAPASTACDEDVWREIDLFKASLRQMAAAGSSPPAGKTGSPTAEREGGRRREKQRKDKKRKKKAKKTKKKKHRKKTTEGSGATGGGSSSSSSDESEAPSTARRGVDKVDGVVFLETGGKPGSSAAKHAFIEAVPVTAEAALDAPMYFRQALMDAGDEWSTHKKCIPADPRKGGVRRAVPKGFPYFHVEWAGGGYAHIIEGEEAKFPRDFGVDTLAGVLGVDPPSFGGKGRRRGGGGVGAGEGNPEGQERKMVLAFLERWKHFDWTSQLDGGEYQDRAS